MARVGPHVSGEGQSSKLLHQLLDEVDVVPVREILRSNKVKRRQGNPPLTGSTNDAGVGRFLRLHSSC